MEIKQGMGLDKYILVKDKQLRLGYTTGSCATAAAKAAAYMLLSGQPIDKVFLTVPKGIELTLPLEDVQMSDGCVSCAVRKDGGDDFDVTHGLLIYARVCKKETAGVELLGGAGVGVVTKTGLSCAVGGPAINPVPYKMITSEVQSVLDDFASTLGLQVTIYVPGGEETATQTFNARLGIQGGISILGTSGIVEPMSEAAIVDTMRLEMDMQLAKGNKNILVFFGNYGEDFTRDSLGISVENAVICSNFVGEMLDYACYLGMESVLLVGHAGKLIKLSMGVMNTHSKYADCRAEPLALYAALSGAPQEIVQSLADCITTMEALKILRNAGLQGAVFDKIVPKIHSHMQHRVHGKMQTEAVVFLNEYGVLGQTPGAESLLKIARGGNK